MSKWSPARSSYYQANDATTNSGTITEVPVAAAGSPASPTTAAGFPTFHGTYHNQSHTQFSTLEGVAYEISLGLIDETRNNEMLKNVVRVLIGNDVYWLYKNRYLPSYSFKRMDLVGGKWMFVTGGSMTSLVNSGSTCLTSELCEFANLVEWPQIKVYLDKLPAFSWDEKKYNSKTF